MSEQLYGQVKIPCVAGLEGATATVSTIKGFSKTITLHSPITDIKLPGMDEYTITQGTSNSVKFTLDCGEYKKTEQFTLVPANLNNASWELIQELIQNGTFSDYYSIGDYKNVTLTDGQVMKMVVASINDGTTLATYYPNKTVDFISDNLLNGTYRYDDSPAGKNVCDCSLYTTVLNSTIYSILPTDVKDKIKSKLHVYFDNYGGSKNGNNNLWLPTLYELGIEGTAVQNNSTYNKQYPLFTSNNSRIKKNNNTAQQWWTSSRTSASYRFYGITVNGAMSDTLHGSSISAYIPLCFRVG